MVKTCVATLVLLGLLGAAAGEAVKLQSSPGIVPIASHRDASVAAGGSPKNILDETFENDVFPPAGWSLSGAANIWARSTGCSGFGIGIASVRADFFNVPGGTQDLVTYICSPTGAADSLVFDRAYAPYTPGTYVDSLTIWTSINGGTNWVKLAGLVGGPGGTLNTAPAISHIFTPAAGQWATKKYALPAGTNRIKFRGHSAYGNELYLDNIKVIYPHAMHDVYVAAVVAPARYQTEDVNPALLVKNFGLNAETFQVYCQITFNAVPVYRESLTVSGLAAGDTQTVSFPLWTPVLGESYGISGWTQLPGDMVPGNDTLSSDFSTYCFPRTVFGMDFTATWCPWCPWHQVAWKKLKDEAGDSLCVIAMHSDPSDSFYQATCGTLASFYGQTIYPTSVVDGLNQFVGSDTVGAGLSQYDVFRAMFDARKNLKARFGIGIIGGYSNDTGWIGAVITYPGMSQIPIDLRCAIIETSKHMDWPTISSLLPQDTLRDFVRMIMPSAAGDTFTIGDGVTIRNYPFTINAGWNQDKLAVVVWATLRGQREVLQSKEIPWSEMIYGVAGAPSSTPAPRTALYPVSPNPTSGRATLRFQVSAACQVSLKVYNIMGQLVKTLVDGPVAAGHHAITWDGANESGNKVASGIYLYRLSAPGFSATRKLSVLR